MRMKSPSKIQWQEKYENVNRIGNCKSLEAKNQGEVQQDCNTTATGVGSVLTHKLRANLEFHPCSFCVTVFSFGID